MKRPLTLIIVLFSALLFTTTSNGQQPSGALENADKLRFQLLEVQTKEETLKLRLDQLDQELRPENIERALAGIGSTRPEDLRENRRRQLSIEKESVLTQLEIVQKTKLRLQIEISAAEVRAYHESAAPTPMPIEPEMSMRSMMPTVPILFTTLSSVVLLLFVGMVFLYAVNMARRTS